MLIDILGLYGFTHLACSLYRAWGPDGEVKNLISAFACDYKVLFKGRQR